MGIVKTVLDLRVRQGAGLNQIAGITTDSEDGQIQYLYTDSEDGQIQQILIDTEDY